MKKLTSLLLVFLLAAALLPAAGVFAEHNFVEVERVEPTCTENGYIDYKCSGCDTIEEPVMITGKNVLTVSELMAYSEKQIPNMRLTCEPEKLIAHYLSIGEKYGIRGDIAYLQAVKETGWFKFKQPGSYLKFVDGKWVRIYEPRPEGLYATPEDNNFCGLGITGKLGDEGSLCRFSTAEKGVTAHIQHLYAYATTAPLPQGEMLIDPRFTYMRRGCADNWVELGNDKWTNSPNYGVSIVNSYVLALKNYSETFGKTCDATKREILPATGHKWSSWKMTKPATHTEAGEETRVCSACLKRETRRVEPVAGLWGDLDGDGDFIVSDALIILRGVSGAAPLEKEAFIISDVDRDEKITVSDALTVLRAAAKIEFVPQNDYPSGRAVTMKAAQNETYFSEPSDSNRSLPQCFWIPKGTTDYIVSESAYSADPSVTYYTLRSGHRVYRKDADVSEKTILKNNLFGAFFATEGKYSFFTAAVSQKTPYQMVMNGLYSGDKYETRANCENFKSISVIFCGAEGAPKPDMPENPLFSSVSMSEDAAAGTVTYTFTLKRTGMFCGYTSRYDDDGNLVLRFNNPITLKNGRIDGTVICIDPGHGGNDSGATANGLVESDENVKVAKVLRQKLESIGATVYMTREGPYKFSDGTTITGENKSSHRIELIASFEPDLLISVHHNYFSNPQAHGTEALYFYGFNQLLAQHVSNSLSAASGMRNRGGKYQNVFVYRTHDFMSFLVEAGFLSNAGDSAWLTKEGNTDILAGAIVNALLTHFA